jgi:alpha-mannosidase
VEDGALVTSFSAYQPRTFAVRLAAPSSKVESVNSVPVPLRYDIASATNDGDHTQSGFDAKGSAFPAEMFPAQVTFNGAHFQLAAAKTNSPNAMIAKGQTIALPNGHYNRLYLLAAAVDGDQKATFELTSKKVELNIQDWSGFVGQWDDRQWTSHDTSHDDYGNMIGLKPGYIKRADLAWYCDHHHNAQGTNVPYAYSYLFAYELDLPENAHTFKLPNNPNIRVFAVSVAEENPETKPVQPLYDILPSANAGSATLYTRFDRTN